MLEEPPGPPRDEPQRLDRLRRQLGRRARRRRRSASHLGDRGSGKPGEREGKGDEEVAFPSCDPRCKRRDADDDASGHLPVVALEARLRAAVQLGGRRPLQKLSPADHQAVQRADDRIAHQPCLVAEEDEGHADLGERHADVEHEGPEMAAERDALVFRQDGVDERQQRAESDRRCDEQSPRDGRGGRQQHQAGDQRRDRQRRRQRPAQVVEHLPSAERRSGRAVADRRGNSSEEPRQELPVAAHPAMLARRRDLVARREVLDHLDVGDEARSREDTFEQVVAQHGVLGHATFQARLERVDVVDALARERSLVEKILVNVGNGEHVGIEAARRREDPLVERVIDMRQRRRHARLHDPVPGDDQAALGIELRPVERMRHLADQVPGRLSRDARVGVERDDVADERRQPAADRHERRVRFTPEKAVELVQLAPLALPAHPPTFRLVPHPAPVQQQER